MSSGNSVIKGCLGSVIGVILLFGGCAYLFGNSYNQATKESSGDAPIDDTSWIPEGFAPFNNKVAIKWSEANTFTCSYGRCAQIEVISKDGCSSLYAEATKVDQAGNNVGFTNATTSNLAPNQKAILMFETSGDFKTFEVAKISCY
jgi:hypothetical protein